jgi:nucleoporin NUP82
MLKEEIRLSPATLDLMTEAHRVLSRETHQLGIAAADLFRRCQRLLEEFHDQIKRTDDLTYRVERLAGEDADDYDEDDPDRPRGNAALVHRLEAARARQEELVERHNELRKKMAKSGRALSEKEEGWVQEIQKLGDSIINSSAKENKDSRNGNVPQYEEPWRRFEEVRSAVIT